MDLSQLASLLHQYNAIGSQIAHIIRRPAQIGHVGEYIAAKIFDIRLEYAANAKGIDGYFDSGPLKGSSVNVKWYAKQENLLAITEALLPDYYLVLTGPPAAAMASRGGQRPWLIRSAFLFAAVPLLEELRRQGVTLGVATSVRKAVWEAAMIYPQSRNSHYVLSDEQRRQLALFEGTPPLEADELSADLQIALAQMAFLNDAALWRAARTSLQHEQQQRLESLHDKQQRSDLSSAEKAEEQALVKLYRETQLVRSHAVLLLMQRGYDMSSPSLTVGALTEPRA